MSFIFRHRCSVVKFIAFKVKSLTLSYSNSDVCVIKCHRTNWSVIFKWGEHEAWFLHSWPLIYLQLIMIIYCRKQTWEWGGPAKWMWLWGRASFSKWLNSSWPWGAVKTPLLIINNSNGLLIANPIEISDVSMLLIQPHANDKDVSLHCSLSLSHIYILHMTL